jgi:type I restriction enzyme S subunit
MGLKTFTINFSELAIDPKVGLKDYSCLYKNGIRLKSFLLDQNVQTGIKSGRTPSRFNEDYWNGENEFLTMSDVDTLTFSINSECVDKITDYAIEEEKTLYQAKQNSLVVSNAMTVGLSFLLDRSVFINQNVFEVNLDETKINKKFVLWYLNLIVRPLFQTTYTSKYLSKDELGRIKIPSIPKSKQDQIVAQIEPIEEKIKELKAQITPPQEVINKVFAREFGFDENLFNEFGKGMTAGTQIAHNRTLRVFETYFEELSRSGIVRFSTRFHNPPTKKLMNFLDSIETLQVKDILLKPVHRGASPKYNPDGEIPIVKTGHLKNGYIEISQEEFVDYDFYNSSKRSQVKQGDILIASTGKVSLGKIDLLEEDQDLVADGHVSIVRIDDEKYSRQFFAYFFRSILGYFQIERDFTGATNQIELYADEISDFQIPNISLKAQQKIVDEIKSELDKQEETKNKIESERNKIDEIIEKAITN